MSIALLSIAMAGVHRTVLHIREARYGLLVAWVCLFAQTAQLQQTETKVETNLVTVPATIIDRTGRSVVGLKQENFEIFEDGLRQDIAVFEAEKIPVTVLLLLDNSSSMRDYMNDLASAANQFVGQLRACDQIIVATFADDSKIHILVPLIQKQKFSEEVILTTASDNGFTTTFNAVDESLKYMSQIAGRKAIVLFSDGEMYGKRVSANTNLRDAEEQDAVIYTIRFGQYPAAPTITVRPTLEEMDRYGNSLGLPPKELKKVIEKVNTYMYGLANRTGGRGFEVEISANLTTAFRTIAMELGQQYRLAYYPARVAKDGERRKIRVRVNLPNVAVRSRSEVVFRKK